MVVNETQFNKVPADAIGLVFTGCSLGSKQEAADWVNGITTFLKSKNVVPDYAKESPPERIWDSITYATTTGGRTDLILICNNSDLNIGRLAMVKLTIPNCTWIEDWLVNYADQYDSAQRGPHATVE